MRLSRTLNWTMGAGLAAFVALGASGQGQVASEEEARQGLLLPGAGTRRLGSSSHPGSRTVTR